MVIFTRCMRSMLRGLLVIISKYISSFVGKMGWVFFCRAEGWGFMNVFSFIGL